MHVAAALSSGSNIHVAAVNGLCVRKFVHFQLNMADVEYYVIVKWGLRNTFCSCAPALVTLLTNYRKFLPLTKERGSIVK